MQKEEIKKENKAMKYGKKIAFSMILIVLVHLAVFFSGGLATIKTLQPYYHYGISKYLPFYFEFYSYLFIALFVFELINFIMGYAPRIKKIITKPVFFVQIFIIAFLLFFVGLILKNILVFYCYFIFTIWAIAFCLYVKLVPNSKKRILILLMIFLFSILVPTFFDNYHLELLYKNRNMKMSTREITFDDKPNFIERIIFCSKKTPVSCKFIRSPRFLYDGWLSLGEKYETSYRVECVYMCPK